MDFFKQLTTIAPGLDLTLKIKQKDGKLSISLLPDNIDKVHPLLLCGTPDELDEGFMAAITRPLSETKTLLANTADYISSLQVSVKEKMEEANKGAKGKPAAPAKKAPPTEKPKSEQEGDDAEEETDEETAKPAKPVAKKKGAPGKEKKATSEKPKETAATPTPKPERELTPLELLMQQ